MPEVSASEAAVIALAKKLAAGKTRRAFMKVVKEADPEIYKTFTDQQIEDFKEEQIAAAEEARITAETRAVEERLAKGRKAILKHFTEEQVKDIETGVMQKYGLADYEAAAKIYAADHAPVQSNARQQTQHGATWELPKYDGLLENPVKAARDMAHRVIDELNAARR